MNSCCYDEYTLEFISIKLWKRKDCNVEYYFLLCARSHRHFGQDRALPVRLQVTLCAPVTLPHRFTALHLQNHTTPFGGFCTRSCILNDWRVFMLVFTPNSVLSGAARYWIRPPCGLSKLGKNWFQISRNCFHGPMSLLMRKIASGKFVSLASQERLTLVGVKGIQWRL